MYRNQNGFTLAQVMITAGLLGGLSLAFMQLTKNMGQAQSFAQSKADEIELVSSIRMILDDERYCRVSLAGDGPSGFPTSPVVFEKRNIDEENEGLDIALYLSNQTGDARTIKKFNGKNNPGTNDKSKFGKLTIKTLKLIMNNEEGINYTNSPSHNDVGLIRAVVEKKISNTQTRELTLDFDVNVGMATGQSPESSGNTRILSCSREGQLPSIKWEKVNLTNTDKWNKNCIYRIVLEPYGAYYYGDKLSAYCDSIGCNILSLGTTHYVGNPKPYLYPVVHHTSKSTLRYYKDFNTTYGSYDPSSFQTEVNRVRQIHKLCVEE